MSAQIWQCMTANCPKVRDIGGSVDFSTGLLDFMQVHNHFPIHASFKSSAAPSSRVAALRNMSQLTALTSLSFRSDEPLEAAALADAVPRLRELHFVALPGLERDCMCLMPLAKVAEQSLNRLCLYFAESRARGRDLHVLLSALSRVPKVVVAGLSGTTEVLESAMQDARAVGLSLPTDMHVVSLRPL